MLGSPSQVLDLGRATNDWNIAQRRGLAIRDRGCVAPGCDRAPFACQAHHRVRWVDGGPTDIDNGALLCDFHHHQVHRQRWHVILAANGYPALIPPTIDRPRTATPTTPPVPPPTHDRPTTDLNRATSNQEHRFAHRCAHGGPAVATSRRRRSSTQQPEHRLLRHGTSRTPTAEAMRPRKAAHRAQPTPTPAVLSRTDPRHPPAESRARCPVAQPTSAVLSRPDARHIAAATDSPNPTRLATTAHLHTGRREHPSYRVVAARRRPGQAAARGRRDVRRRRARATTSPTTCSRSARPGSGAGRWPARSTPGPASGCSTWPQAPGRRRCPSSPRARRSWPRLLARDAAGRQARAPDAGPARG